MSLCQEAADALSAPVQEPVAWADMDVRGEDKGLSWTPGRFHTQPLYTTPPAAPVQEPVEKYYADGGHIVYPAAQRQWVGLTDEEIEPYYAANKPLIKWVEAKLKEKNT
jgi:hypothetical protein